MGHFNKFGGGSGDRGFSAKGGPASGWGERGHDRHGGGPRPMFQAVCSKCGQNCEVPFKPTGDRPVFCNNCFKNKGDGGPKFAPKNFGGGNVPPAGGGVSKGQFDVLNAKLDRILGLLAPAKTEVPARGGSALPRRQAGLGGKEKPAKKEAAKKTKAPAKKSKTKKK